MIPGVNPAMIGFVVKGKLDELIEGKAPDGFVIKERSAGKIVLAPKEVDMFEGVKLNSLSASISYRQTEIIFTHA